MSKLNQILVGALALQVIIAAVVLWPRPAATAEGESLFPGVEAGQIVGLTITSGDGQTLQLAKQDGTWVLPGADGYPVQADKVPQLLDKIVALKAERMVAQTDSSHARLKVASDDFERLVEIEMSDGTRHRFYVGTSPSYSVSHVRVDGQDQVYLTSELSAQDAGAQASIWIDRTYLEVPRDQIVGLTLENANGTFSFARAGETWTMEGLSEGETLDQASVGSIVNRAALVTMTEPLGKETQDSYGMQAPSAVVTLQASSDEGGDKTYVLRVGAQDPDSKNYVVISSESPYHVLVTESAVKDLVEKAREGFLELPPTPEATPSNP